MDSKETVKNLKRNAEKWLQDTWKPSPPSRRENGKGFENWHGIDGEGHCPSATPTASPARHQTHARAGTTTLDPSSAVPPGSSKRVIFRGRQQCAVSGRGRRCTALRLSLNKGAEMCALVCTTRRWGGTVDGDRTYAQGLERKEVLLSAGSGEQWKRSAWAAPIRGAPLHCSGGQGFIPVTQAGERLPGGCRKEAEEDCLEGPGHLNWERPSWGAAAGRVRQKRLRRLHPEWPTAHEVPSEAPNAVPEEPNQEPVSGRSRLRAPMPLCSSVSQLRPPGPLPDPSFRTSTLAATNKTTREGEGGKTEVKGLVCDQPLWGQGVLSLWIKFEALIITRGSGHF